ncbi:adenylosuccinate lyase [Oceanispirochaeta crateris]|jgi:adenylosuccinate lyase|uniref:Adenylosuccinate lyase n=1 Tax=Oceanispirochaeta crateris TaxID=2518645 RepID=A0A5C1QL49_9SPIO|nr:lyase family protein [Oceanispirochaeta crateris]QEN07680.1 adenylosuccinate lyase [Oceanispirochaeta crateris]
MENRSIYRNISPLDHRYYQSNKELFEALSNTLSEEATVAYCVKAEMALLKTHIQLQNLGDQSLIDSLDDIEKTITPEEVYKEEEKTQHNIRALVNVINKKVPEKLKPWVHMGATSVDMLDTANSMRMRDVTRNTILPLLLELEEELIKMAEAEAETPQVGRTHGQHAVPVTLGFALAEYVSRLGQSIREMERLSSNLRGKLAGAVGGYNATSMITADPLEMEKIYLKFLGLKPSEYSTQMVEPEYLLRLLLEYNTAFGIIANLADDLRHLQRSEIDEVREFFSATQVGSSTMPQKRNPWNCEHVKSLWKAFAPRVMSFYMDQISEHQRDLSNSASARFQADFIAGFAAATSRMKKIMAGMTVNKPQLTRNLTVQGDFVLAEPTYILLAMSGVNGAHEIVRNITLSCEKTGKTIMEVLQTEQPESWTRIKVQLKKVSGLDAENFYSDPSLYRGKTAEKTRSLCSQYSSMITEIKGVLS